MCHTLTSNGQRVGLLVDGSNTPGTFYATCSEPAGRSLYVPYASQECSSLPSNHGKFGTSDQQLTLCARTNFNPTMSATVDGMPVNVWKLLAATGVYALQVAPGNVLGLPPGSGRSADYGSGLLLTGLATGIHVIHVVFAWGTSSPLTAPLTSPSTPTNEKWDDTFMVHVQ